MSLVIHRYLSYGCWGYSAIDLGWARRQMSLMKYWEPHLTASLGRPRYELVGELTELPRGSLPETVSLENLVVSDILLETSHTLFQTSQNHLFDPLCRGISRYSS